MKLLGIDFGMKKIGLASAITPIAEVYGVIRFKKIDDAIKKIGRVVDEENIKRIVIGISEGKMAEDTRNFGERLEKEFKIPVEYQDETLSTKEAQALSIEAGIGRKKRRKLEDAYSAAIILQQYIDSK